MKRSPFHEGELQIQKRANEGDMALQSALAMKDFIPAGALRFIEKQSMFVVSSLDNEQNIWTSIVVGRPGFVTATDERNIHVHLPSIVSSKSDPFWKNIENQQHIGLLFIELATRRRLRVNGTVARSNGNLHISVEQAYPNCPKYIQRREMAEMPAGPAAKELIRRGSCMTGALQEWIKKSDTFFIGSSDDQKNLDVSHRGGNPGFINVVDDHTLMIPDYPGNGMFNTLGNLKVNPKAGLLFVDFETGNTLQLVGEATIIWDETGAEKATGGTRRFWKFLVPRWIQTDSTGGIVWHSLDYSPFNP